jgi:hypothetical protein
MHLCFDKSSPRSDFSVGEAANPLGWRSDITLMRRPDMLALFWKQLAALRSIFYTGAGSRALEVAASRT